MEAGIEIDGSLTEVGRLRLENSELRQSVWLLEAKLDGLRDGCTQQSKNIANLANMVAFWRDQYETCFGRLKRVRAVLAEIKAVNEGSVQ